jgi:hypothetical protein
VSTIDSPITKKQLATLTLIGLAILVLFAAGFAWLSSHAGEFWTEEKDVFLAFAPFWVFPYLIVSSIYVGYLVARFVKGKRKHVWLWGGAGFALTFLFITRFPILLSPLFPHSSPMIFAGPAIFAFIAPVISALLIILLISFRRKAAF